MGRWLAAAAWTALLLAVSSDLFSSSHTGGLLEALIGGLVSPAMFEHVHFVLRKVGHLTGYGIAATLYCRALRGPVTSYGLRVAKARPRQSSDPGARNAVPPQPATRNSQLLALALVLAVASLDELHQSTIPSRTGTPVDVLIDLSGGTLALLVRRGEWRGRANC
jgi:hypothetical protein